MRVLSVDQKSYEGGLEFADLDSIKEALRVFASGRSVGSGETSRLGFADTAAGGIGLMMKMTLDSGHEDSFLKRLFGQLDGITTEHGFSQHYDYDGPGKFFKTSVEVKKSEASFEQADLVNVYTLYLNAAYVGDEVSAGLAEVLGANRALWRDEVVITVEPVGERFEFDFDHVVEKFDSIGLGNISGQQFADHMMAQTELGVSDKAKFSLPVRNDDLVVDIGIQTYSVEGPIDYSTREVIWELDGSRITGPVSHWGDEVSKPRLFASISVPKKDDEPSWDRTPIFDPKVKQAIHDQAKAIVGAFQ